MVDPLDAGAEALRTHPLLQEDPSMITDRFTARRVVEDLVEAMRKAAGQSPIDDDLVELVRLITWTEDKYRSGLAEEDKHALIFKVMRSSIDPLIERLGLSFSYCTVRDSYEREVHALMGPLTNLKDRILAEKAGGA